MKKLFVLLLFFTCLSASAQDSSKVEQYCELVATARLLSLKVTVDVDYGEQRSIWKDYRVKDDDGRFQKFNSVVDALNYLGRQGWKMVNAFPVTTGSQLVYHYVFKKEFDKAQTEEK